MNHSSKVAEPVVRNEICTGRPQNNMAENPFNIDKSNDCRHYNRQQSPYNMPAQHFDMVCEGHLCPAVPVFFIYKSVYKTHTRLLQGAKLGNYRLGLFPVSFQNHKMNFFLEKILCPGKAFSLPPV